MQESIRQLPLTLALSYRHYGKEFRTAYYAWLKWNLTSRGKPSPHYKGHLVRGKLESEGDEDSHKSWSDHGEEEVEEEEEEKSEAGAAVKGK